MNRAFISYPVKSLPVLLFFVMFFLNSVIIAQGCHEYIPENYKYSSEIKDCKVEIHWYDEWVSKRGRKLPKSLSIQKHYKHPYVKQKYASSMHENPSCNDVSNYSGPGIEDVKVQYFQCKQKGKGFSGMCPTFTFVDDTTLVALSFGRAETTLLLLHIGDSIKVLDTLPVPGRGNTALDLATKKARMDLFKNTSGGAYFYLSNNDNIYIPGSNNNIIRIKVENRSFDRNNMRSINIQEQILAGSLIEPELASKEELNVLTAIMPDTKGNIWFTSKFGIIGLIHRFDKFEDDECPKVYASFIGFYGAKTKIKTVFKEGINDYDSLFNFKEGNALTPQERKLFVEKISKNPNLREEIQNSFSMGSDGVYIVSNVALYKFRFNEETKLIELDPEWKEQLYNGELIYENDFSVKPGHLNNGSGTTPTLMDERFVAIADNDTNQINICVFNQENGKIVYKHKVFTNKESACENSIVAYNNSFLIANTYGYTDPFKNNSTKGGITRFDYNRKQKTFEVNKEWKNALAIDAKTSTPKLSTKSGLVYVYNRSDSSYNAHKDWQLTAIDFNSGKRVFSIRPYFEKGYFKDNISSTIKSSSLGTKNYDRKVFNNIWATYTFGPNNSVYIGAYRGFIRFSSK